MYVYAVGTVGYGGASSSLLLPGPTTASDGNGQYYVTTDSSGSFVLTGGYACTAGTQVYIYVSGGNPGLGSGSNAAIGLMAALGECPATGTLALSVPHVVVNEVSTVAMAYALAGFATGPTHISSSDTPLAATGVANAMNNALNLVAVSSGTAAATTLNGAGVPPGPEIDTLANILASCVNSSGPGSVSCQPLFGYTGNATDTAAAALAIAHAPFSNVSGLFGLSTANAPFQPTLVMAPSDFTLSILYPTAQSASGTYIFDALAIDAGGNVWTRGEHPAPGSNGAYADSTAFVKYSPQADVLVTRLSDGGADAGIRGLIDVDASGNLWDASGTGVYEFAADGSQASPTGGFTCSGMSLTQSTVFGADGVVYVGDYSSYNTTYNQLANTWKLSPTGACEGNLSADYYGSGVPVVKVIGGYVSIDSGGSIYAGAEPTAQDEDYIYVSIGGSASYRRFAADTNFSTYNVFSAFDSSGDLWVLNPNNYAALERYTSAGTELSPVGGFSGGGLAQTGYSETIPYTPSLNVDGAGAAWTAVLRCAQGGYPCYSAQVVGLAIDGTPITPATGLQAPPRGDGQDIEIASDGSGSLWMLSTDGSLIEYIGLTTPVATPTLLNQLGARP